MANPSNIKAIEATTGRSWEAWVNYLDSVNAKQLTHREIADKAYGELRDVRINRGWWSQSIAVAYEQQIGRRSPGQRSDGSYEVAVNKTFAGTIDSALDAWLELTKNRAEFSSVPIVRQATLTKTEKWRHWRVVLSDNTRITASIHAVQQNKAILTITHAKLNDAETMEQWRAFWKNFLEAF